MPTFLKTLLDLLAKKLGGDVLEGESDENEIKELFVSTNSMDYFGHSPALSTPSCVSIDISDSDIALCRTPETYSLQYAQQGFLKKALKKEETTHKAWMDQNSRNKRTNDDISRRSSVVFGSQDSEVIYYKFQKGNICYNFSQMITMKAGFDSTISRPKMTSKSESIKEIFLQECKAVVSPKRSTPSFVSLNDDSDAEGLQLKATLSIESIHQIEGRLLTLQYENKRLERDRRILNHKEGSLRDFVQDANATNHAEAQELLLAGEKYKDSMAAETPPEKNESTTFIPELEEQ